MWRFKLLLKILLSQFNIPYSFFKNFPIFKHGKMNSVDYAINVFISRIEIICPLQNLTGKKLLELGPGDSLASAVLGSTFGSEVVLVDVSSYASCDTNFYIDLTSRLRSMGLSPPQITANSTVEDTLQICNANYMTSGLVSLKAIPDNSIDIIFSQAVLEHVRKQDFFQLLLECRRILKPGGICSHQVDLKDHLGGSLNHLRFHESIWESPLFAKSGFYTNRIRYDQMVELFKKAGFNVDVSRVLRWASIPIDTRHLSQKFQSLSDKNLLVQQFDVLLK